jgi:hypothetical protein
MKILSLVAIVLALVPTSLSGYYRFRDPGDMGTGVLFAAAFCCGWLTGGVMRGAWWLLFAELAVVLPATIWGIRRLRRNAQHHP